MRHATSTDFARELDEELATQLGVDPRCPRCGLPLERDPYWSRPYYMDGQSHTYSNIRVLLDELRESSAVYEPSRDARLHTQTG